MIIQWVRSRFKGLDLIDRVPDELWNEVRDIARETGNKTIPMEKNRKMCVYIYAAAAAKSLQSCPTLCDPRDGSPPGSPVPGILQAGTLEWVAISFSNA